MRPFISSIVIGLTMVVASGLAITLRPTNLVSADVVDFDTAIPKHFGDWDLAPSLASPVVNDQQRAILDTIYSQQVNRVYLHRPTGMQVILVLAYGQEQSKSLQVHRPEICYPAQGFQIVSTQKDSLNASGISIPVLRLVSQQERRVEPITYWIRIGDSIVRGALDQKIAIVSMGLRGQIADGLLFRVSSISSDTTAAFRLHDLFVRDILSAMPAKAKASLLGTIASAT